ncbi:MAG: TROVE domain-containing protein, partial [Planctomycetes bacterium]|nr:TROVE domain-containing protein [Planctomycetota bacterium]
RKAFAKLYTSRTGPELAVLLTKYKNREGWTHVDLISLLHINPAEMKDDGGRLVLEWFMKKDKPERTTKDGVVVPATFERTEFLKRLQAIPTPPAPAVSHQQQQQQQQQPHQLSSSVAAPASGEKVCVHFNIISGPMAGEDDVALKIGLNEPLSNLVQTFAEIGAGNVEFRFNTTTIGPHDTVAMLIKQGFDAVKRKIYVKTVAAAATTAAKAATNTAIDDEFVIVSAVTPTSTAATAAKAPESEQKVPLKEKEDPLVATARFLKALIELARTGATKDSVTALRVMRDVRRIQREHLPTELLSLPTIWSALLDELGVMALVRNLNKLSSTGVTNTRGGDIVRMLCDPKRIADSKIHPFAVLVAIKTYSTGKSDLGSSTWPVNSSILLAMSTTFKLSFGNVPRTGKRIMIALDVSGSMSSAYCAGSTSVNCREGSVAMAMATLHAEGAANTQIYAFTTTFRNMNGRIRPEMSINDAMSATNDAFGGTDCAIPMVEAKRTGMKIDAFVVYTDSETYAPSVHPQVALEQYRKSTGIDAKLIVVGMASNCLSIADHKDPNTLNLAGFDTSTPNLISMFINGEL